MTDSGKERILVVDDETAIRTLINAVLAREGFETASAATGEEALKLLEQQEFAVLIADIRLPGMDGLELVTRIKKSHDTDVIVVTGDADHHSYEEAVKSGASDFILKPIHNEELVLRLRRVLEERNMRQTRAQMLKDLQKLVITDNLTQLFNSRHFNNQIEIEIGRANRYKHPLSLLLMDIDHFKSYNDEHGHLEGDKALVRIGQIVTSCLRRTDSAYRYGGEEFTVLLPETDVERAGLVAERIRAAVADKVFEPKPQKQARVTVSIGVTQYAPGEETHPFILRADKAMYVSKHNGRNTVTALPPSSTPSASHDAAEAPNPA